MLADLQTNGRSSPAPYAFTIADAVTYSGCSRSRLYDAIKAGELDARQVGRRTLIVGESLRAFLDRLPSTGARPRPAPPRPAKSRLNEKPRR